MYCLTAGSWLEMQLLVLIAAIFLLGNFTASAQNLFTNCEKHCREKYCAPPVLVNRCMPGCISKCQMYNEKKNRKTFRSSASGP